MRGWVVAAATLVLAACSSPGEASVDPDVVGSWIATTGDPAGVIAAFNDDGTFTWSNGSLSGTFTADGTTLTFMFPDDSSYCPAGTLSWGYEVTGDTLTSDVIAVECPPAEPASSLAAAPPSPDWIFERQ